MTREEAAQRLEDKAADPYYIPRMRKMYELAAKALREPEVILCKDCAHRAEAEANYKGFLICPVSGMDITEYDFCSYATKKEVSES